MSEPSKRWNGWGTAMVVSFAVAILAPVFGIIGTSVGMVGAFEELESTEGADPATLSGNIGVSLITTLAGFGGAVLGLILGFVFLVLFLKKRSQPAKPKS